MPAIQEYWKSGGLNSREEETKAVFQTWSGGGSGGWGVSASWGWSLNQGRLKKKKVPETARRAM